MSGIRHVRRSNAKLDSARLLGSYRRVLISTEIDFAGRHVSMQTPGFNCPLRRSLRHCVRHAGRYTI